MDWREHDPHSSRVSGRRLLVARHVAKLKLQGLHTLIQVLHLLSVIRYAIHLRLDGILIRFHVLGLSWFR